MSNYAYILIEQDPAAAVLDAVMNVDKDYQLLEDVSLKDSFPDGAYFTMLPDYGMQLCDVVNNGSDVLLVSERVRLFFEAQEEIRDIEMLPVTIVDHKGRAVEASYYILHLRGHQDCIDEEKTEVERWASDPENFSSVFDLTLDESRIDPEKAIFRLQRYPYPVVVRQDFAERLTQEAFSGLTFDDIENFDHFAIL